MKYGFDLDGCLAQFNVPFYELLVARHGKRGPADYAPDQPPCWEWPRFLGYSEAEEKACWNEVWEGRTFWQQMDVIPGEERTIQQLNAINVHDGHEIHFITNRRGEAVQYQSAWFLSKHGFRQPSVIIASDKFPVIRALRLDAYIDDKLETANDLAVENAKGTIHTRAYLRSTRHNAEKRHPRLRVVNSVWEMLELEGLT